jgi:uncharacterized membrane protein YGL010W
MKTVNQWLEEYGASHQNETNKSIHWICVPAIFFSIVGLLFSIKLPVTIDAHTLNVAFIALFLIFLYYLRVSVAVGIGMLLFGVICMVNCHFIEMYVPVPLWLICLIIFVLSWIGQFYVHKVEGKKHYFFKDIQFLLIVPMLLISFI